MTKELLDTLEQEFPFIKKCWEFSIGDGWFNLVYKLCKDLKLSGFTGKLNQCKEKFGTLRWYVDTATDYQWSLISQAEDDSAKICEYCGKRGKTRSIYGWFYTTCIYHAFRIWFDIFSRRNF